MCTNSVSNHDPEQSPSTRPSPPRPRPLPYSAPDSPITRRSSNHPRVRSHPSPYGARANAHHDARRDVYVRPRPPAPDPRAPALRARDRSNHVRRRPLVQRSRSPETVRETHRRSNARGVAPDVVPGRGRAGAPERIHAVVRILDTIERSRSRSRRCRRAFPFDLARVIEVERGRSVRASRRAVERTMGRRGGGIWATRAREGRRARGRYGARRARSRRGFARVRRVG